MEITIADRVRDYRDAYPEFVDEQGLITFPGRFEGQPVIAQVLYIMALDGMWDDMTGDTEVGRSLAGFILTTDEAETLGVTEWLALYETPDGFVTFQQYDSEADYQAALREVDDDPLGELS